MAINRAGQTWPNEQVTEIAPDGLTRYHVIYKDAASDKFTQVFACWADNFEHAYEQARDAYPDAVMVNATTV